MIALDAATKALAVHFLAGRGVVNILGGSFHLELYRNFSGPGNTFSGHPVLVSVLAAVAVAAIAVVAMFVRGTTTAIAFGLLLGAGIGNLLDRLLRAPGPFRGGVVDWLKPDLSSGSMNLADLAINAAMLVLVIGWTLQWFRSRREDHDPGPPLPQPSPPAG